MALSIGKLDSFTLWEISKEYLVHKLILLRWEDIDVGLSQPNAGRATGLDTQSLIYRNSGVMLSLRFFVPFAAYDFGSLYIARQSGASLFVSLYIKDIFPITLQVGDENAQPED